MHSVKRDYVVYIYCMYTWVSMVGRGRIDTYHVTKGLAELVVVFGAQL